ncbi:MAG: 2-amino-4-oxopentanoate thiolase subunit OrtA [Thermoanaerobacteraceae bacterium]|nr:2-amino-4-oxopentanoate thiolase subunit OrtA [Thermoanaerobacteraceae bacterium]
MDAKKGDWVQIHSIILKPEERASHLPEDTKRVPLEMWEKGFILHDANVGDEVEIETVIGRRAKGILVKVNPVYEHNFGEPVPELLNIGMELRKILEGEGHE